MRPTSFPATSSNKRHYPEEQSKKLNKVLVVGCVYYKYNIFYLLSATDVVVLDDVSK